MKRCLVFDHVEWMKNRTTSLYVVHAEIEMSVWKYRVKEKEYFMH